MKFRLCLTSILLALFCGACQKTPPTPPPTATGIDPVYGHLLTAQPKLPTIKVWLGDQELVTEIAHERLQIATGMMYRTNMPENEAMIFVFPDATPRSFYMRNCFVPLSAAYIAPDGTILEIIQMQPHDEKSIPSQSSNVQFVLEVPQGWFERHKVKAGSLIRTERGTLKESFFRQR
jgi:uncharacterized membrane protein (UPF0127 family)